MENKNPELLRRRHLEQFKKAGLVNKNPAVRDIIKSGRETFTLKDGDTIITTRKTTPITKEELERGKKEYFKKGGKIKKIEINKNNS